MNMYASGGRVLRSLIFLGVGLPAAAAQAAEPAELSGEEPMEEVVIFGRAERQLGIAQAASEGAVGGADLSVRPIMRVAELLEVVPGLIAGQHSGSGKANQYFLRGMNLDHGTDFTTHFDHVPLNFRTHGHGQGYLDINGIIPETISRIDYRKGPYRADLGDFALAGAALLTSVHAYEAPFAQGEVGDFGYRRLVAGGTEAVADGDLTLVGQWKTYDGPWEVSEDLKHFSGYGKYARGTGLGELNLTFSGYSATWRSTEQIPERAIGNTFSEPGLPTVACRDEYCAIDPTANGLTTRFIATATLYGNASVGNVYAQYYNWHMSSNPTLWLDDPVNGDQINQFDRRWIFGGKYETNFPLSSAVFVKAGVEGRYDDIPRVGVFHTRAHEILSVISAHSVEEASAAVYTEVNWQIMPALRAMGGLRADTYSFDVTPLDPGSSGGSADASLLSPKAGLVYKAAEWLEFYGNWGHGFHSNDARGITTLGQQALAKGEGWELGGRVQVGNFNFTAAYWWLENESELVFVGDTNSVEPRGGSARQGYELVLFWRPFDWLAVDGVWTETRARFVDSPGAKYIPGALEQAAELGISAIWQDYEAGLRLRYIGPYPLIEDNSERNAADPLLNLRVAWKPGRYTLSLELLNALDHRSKDVVYVYTTRLPGEPPEGVDGRVSRAHDPRTIRVGLRVEL